MKVGGRMMGESPVAGAEQGLLDESVPILVRASEANAMSTSSRSEEDCVVFGGRSRLA